MSNATKDKTQTTKSSVISKTFKALPMKHKALILALAVMVIVLIALLVLTNRGVKSEVGGGMTPQGIREIAEFASLEFRYSDVIEIVEEQEFKLFGLWDIDPGESILIVRYDGIIKLGIDSKELKFNESQPTPDGKIRVEILMPEIRIISSERPQDSFEIIVNRGIHTKDKIGLEAFFDAAKERQAQHDAEALEAYSQSARDSAKRQLESLFEQFNVNENYEIIWVN